MEIEKEYGNMGLVATKKNQPKSGKQTKPTEPLPSDPERGRVGQNLNVWLDDTLMDAFETLRQEHRRTKTAEVSLMMEDWLRKFGKWPPAGPASGE